MTLESVSGMLVGGLVLGSLYALMAAGLSLVWSTLRVFNFAHGALLTLAAYLAWFVSNPGGLGLGLLAGMVGAVTMVGFLGIMIERALVRPFLRRSHPDIVVMISTLAVAGLLQGIILFVWGGKFKQLDRIAVGSIQLIGTAISYHDLAIIVLAPTILITLAAVLRRTRFGLAVRGVAQNSDAATLVGIGLPRVYRLTFGISSALAGLAGVLLGAIFFMTPDLGTDPLLKAFVVVVLGGVGSLSGTVAAAYMIGLVEAASMFFFGLGITPAVIFGAMILTLLLRPRGLAGEVA